MFFLLEVKVWNVSDLPERSKYIHGLPQQPGTNEGGDGRRRLADDRRPRTHRRRWIPLRHRQAEGYVFRRESHSEFEIKHAGYI